MTSDHYLITGATGHLGKILVEELLAKLGGSTQPLLTPYSVYTLGTNAIFSHEKAARELRYTVPVQCVILVVE